MTTLTLSQETDFESFRVRLLTSSFPLPHVLINDMRNVIYRPLHHTAGSSHMYIYIVDMYLYLKFSLSHVNVQSSCSSKKLPTGTRYWLKTPFIPLVVPVLSALIGLQEEPLYALCLPTADWAPLSAESISWTLYESHRRSGHFLRRCSEPVEQTDSLPLYIRTIWASFRSKWALLVESPHFSPHMVGRTGPPLLKRPWLVFFPVRSPFSDMLHFLRLLSKLSSHQTYLWSPAARFHIESELIIISRVQSFRTVLWSPK
jgi:hypothetical protein